VFRSASEQAAYLAGVLRRAHLDGMPWSRMAVLVRSTAASLGTLRRAMITAGVPVTVRGEDIPLAEQPAVAMLLDVLSAVLREDALDEDSPNAYCSARSAAATACTCAACAACCAGVPRRGRPDGAGGGRCPGRAGAGRVGPPAGAAGLRRAGRWPLGSRPVARGPALGDLGRQRSRPAVEAASVGGGVFRRAADRDLDAVVQLFAALARFVDRLPGAKADQFTAHLAPSRFRATPSARPRPNPRRSPC